MRSLPEARAAWQADAPFLAERGVHLPDVATYIPDEWRSNSALAMDAQPTLTTTPNGGIPSFLTTSIDPKVFEILFAPNKASEIITEVRAGTWTDQTRMFPTVEHVGEVTSYGDFATGGHADTNFIFPERQSYLFQTTKELGELEIERAGLAMINLVAEKDKAAATVLAKFQNLTYFYGVGGLLNYGLLNDPSLPAALTPGTKAAGNANRWVTTSNTINGTANEIYADIQSLFAQLVAQSTGLITETDPLILALSPVSAVGLTAANSYNVNVRALLKENFPNIKIVTAMQYGAYSASNPQGIAGGNLVQLIAPTVEGQEVGFAAFNEKMRAHRVVQAESSYRQKITAGTWGAVIRQPFAVAQMLGV